MNKTNEPINQKNYKIIETKKVTFISDRADHPTTDYKCGNCGCDDSIYEDDIFCRMCGAKFTGIVNEEVKGKYGCRWEGGTGISPTGRQCGECCPDYEDKCEFLKARKEMRDELIQLIFHTPVGFYDDSKSKEEELVADLVLNSGYCKESEIIKDVFEDINEIFRRHYNKYSDLGSHSEAYLTFNQFSRGAVNSMWHEFFELKKMYLGDKNENKQ